MARQLTALEAEQYLNEILEVPANRKCIVCTNPSREWACTYNGVFLCLNCAAECKHLKENICNIKSINLDTWNEKDIQLLKAAGNQRFFDFMEEYQLNTVNFEDRLCTRAALYYR